MRAAAMRGANVFRQHHWWPEPAGEQTFAACSRFCHTNKMQLVMESKDKIIIELHIILPQNLKRILIFLEKSMVKQIL